MLHLYGYDLSLDDLKSFRQLGSKTPGHPEYHHTPGVEVTTGPLGQGFANAVGMAIAEAHLAATYNKGETIVDHYTYVLAGDGDLMEGVSYEAASIAGHLGLGKLIALYDDNKISLAGNTEITFTESVQQRFEAQGWHTQFVGTEFANDVPSIDNAIAAAKAVTDKPSLILVRSIIGFGSPKANTFGAHGEPLGVDNVAKTKVALGWPVEPTFLIPPDARRSPPKPRNAARSGRANGMPLTRAGRARTPISPPNSSARATANCPKRSRGQNSRPKTAVSPRAKPAGP